MDNKKSKPMAKAQELKPKQSKALQEFKNEMDDQVIPKILETVERRRRLAAESRRQQLKC